MKIKIEKMSYGEIPRFDPNPDYGYNIHGKIIRLPRSKFSQRVEMYKKIEMDTKKLTYDGERKALRNSIKKTRVFFQKALRLKAKMFEKFMVKNVLICVYPVFAMVDINGIMVIQNYSIVGFC